MLKWTTFLCSLAALVIAVGLAGCGDSATELSPEEATIQKALAELPEADRAAAEKQRVCPVGESRLGSMGTPVKATVTDSQGQQHEVFLCCAACEEAIKADPDAYLAMLSLHEHNGEHTHGDDDGHTHGQ